jgi:ABC-type multidrug transport system permease subunit
MRYISSFRSWLAGWTVSALLFGVLGAFGLAVMFVVIGIAYGLPPSFSVAGMLAMLAVVTVLGVELLDALDRRRRDTRDDRG